MSDYKVLEVKDGCISAVKCNGITWTRDEAVAIPLTKKEKNALDTFTKLTQKWRKNRRK